MSSSFIGFTNENFMDLLLSYRDMFVDDRAFGAGYVTSCFSELDMFNKGVNACKKLFLDYGSVNLGIDLEKEYSSLFSVSDYGVGSGLIFKKLLFYDVALRMYDVLGSFVGDDNPFFDESDETCLNGLIQKLQRCEGDENIDFLDYRGALKFATKSMTNNKTLFLEEISNQDMFMYNKGFVLDYFHEGWISPFYSKGVGFKINVMVNNIYIDDMRVVLNGVAARKLGSEVWVSLKMPRSCHDTDKDAYQLYPDNLKGFQFGFRDVALLLMEGDMLKCISD